LCCLGGGGCGIRTREGVNPTRFCSGLVRRGVCRRMSANTPGRRKAGFPQTGGLKLRPELRLAASMSNATPFWADLIRTAFPQVRACFHLAEDAGFEPARAVNPTRFPSCLRRCSLGFSPSAMSAVAGPDSSANREERGQLRRELRRRQRGQRLLMGSGRRFGRGTVRFGCWYYTF
jgi:hypothetical protein